MPCFKPCDSIFSVLLSADFIDKWLLLFESCSYLFLTEIFAIELITDVLRSNPTLAVVSSIFLEL